MGFSLVPRATLAAAARMTQVVMRTLRRVTMQSGVGVAYHDDAAAAASCGGGGGGSVGCLK